MADDAAYRLPRTVRPRRYQLELAPDLAAASFGGTARIDVDVVEPTSVLVLNAADLVIGEASVRTPSGATLRGQVTLDEVEQRAVVTLPEALAPGSGYALDLRFTGVLNDRLHGFYRSTFTGADGTEHTIATTQFEPADARRAFPCWDEPEFKATFAVTLVIDGDLTALSNGDVVADEPTGDGRRRVTFSETMVMSTYLVAFVVGPFEVAAAVDVDGVPLRIAAVPGRSRLTRYAAEAGAHALRFLSGYFDIPYPGGKIDHVAIPDFAFGAMENLGCVTYRENALLVDEDIASQLELQRVATVVSHETAHMWFGDLVTMRWWNGIWLNEAFATFMELTTTEAFNPAWQVWTAFGAGKAAAMATDGLVSTRPVEFAVGRPEEAEAMFDVLTYQKGGAVLRMLEQYLGPEMFRKGISQYLSTHAYGNTETTDLWDSIEAVSGEPVRAIMDSWIGQGGHPLVSVERGADPSSITLRQRRFMYTDASGAGETWAVPINLRASVRGTVQRQRLLLDGREAVVSFDGPVDWVVVNDGGWGFYRVRYAPDLLGRLTARGLREICDPLERLALVVDTWAAVVAGLAELPEWVGVVDALAGEDDPDVWTAVNSVLDLLDLIADDTDRTALQSFARRIAGPVWSTLGWEESPTESERLHMTRARLLSTLGLVGADGSVRAETAERFGRQAADRRALPPDLLTPAAHVVAASGGEEGWSSILARYRQAETPQDKVRYLLALGAAGEPALLARSLDLALGPEVRLQDAPFLIQTVMGRRQGGALAWEWVERSWDEIRSRFPASFITRIFEGVAALLDPGLTAAVHRFVETHEIPVAGPRIDQLLERMDINRDLAGRLRSHIASAVGSP